MDGARKLRLFVAEGVGERADDASFRANAEMLPLETSVTMNLEVKEFPHLKAQQKLKNVKFTTSRDKFM